MYVCMFSLCFDRPYNFGTFLRWLYPKKKVTKQKHQHRGENLRNLTRTIRVRSMGKSLRGLTRWSPKLENLLDPKFLPQHIQPHFKLTANVSKNSNTTQRAPPKSPSCRSMNDCHSPKVIVPDPTTLMTSNTRCGLRHIATN